MMAKRLDILILLLLGAASFIACDYLGEDPLSYAEEDEAYTTSSGVYRNAVQSLYSYFGSGTVSESLQGGYRGVYDLQTFSSDEALIPTRGASGYDGGLWMTLHCHSWTPSSSVLLSVWNYLYKVVGLCNHSLKVLSESTVVSEEDRKSWSAEVTAIRCLYYYYLMDLFGGVPLITTDSDSFDDVTLCTRREMMYHIFDTLSGIRFDLTDDTASSDGSCYGRITRPVAEFLMAKIALNAEVYADNDWTDSEGVDGSNITFEVEPGVTMDAWAAVHYLCEEIEYVDDTGYQFGLEENFGEVFCASNEESCEIIFPIPIDRTLYTNVSLNIRRSLHPSHATYIGAGKGENAMSASLDALSIFGYPGDGMPGYAAADDRFTSTYFTELPYEKDHILMDAFGDTLRYKATAVRMETTASDCERSAGARMAKYVWDTDDKADGLAGQNDIVLFRYADVLLMDAEACLRMGDTDHAQGLFDKVRKRALNPDGNTPEEEWKIGINYHTLLDERLRELAWEGWRRQDLIRFGQFTRPWADRPVLSGENAGAAGRSSVELYLRSEDTLDGEVDLSDTIDGVYVYDTSYDPSTGSSRYEDFYKRRYLSPAAGYTTVFPIPQSILGYYPQMSQNPGY